jgi:hypothetical protein
LVHDLLFVFEWRIFENGLHFDAMFAFGIDRVRVVEGFARFAMEARLRNDELLTKKKTY